MAPLPIDPYAAYGRAQGSALSLRQADCLALTGAANLLAEACRSSSRPHFEAALKRNQRLWTQIQRLVSAPDHALAVQVRADLLSLAGFVDRQTLKALLSGDVADIRPLIEINREVAAGLTE